MSLYEAVRNWLRFCIMKVNGLIVEPDAVQEMEGRMQYYIQHGSQTARAKHYCGNRGWVQLPSYLAIPSKTVEKE